MIYKPLFSLVLCSALYAQSTTLPAGYDNTSGPSYHWAGWSANDYYVPSRCTYCYDLKYSPWVPPFTISRISLRPHTNLYHIRADDHTKKIKIRMSTDGFTVTRPNWHFTRNMGIDASYVFGGPTTYKDANFKGRTTYFSNLAFDTVIDLDKPFNVPAGAKTLQVEFISLSNSTTDKYWYVDAHYDQAALDSGWTTILEGKCPTTLKDPWRSVAWPGAEVVVTVDATFMAVPVVGFLGTERVGGPLKLGPCTFYPQVFALLTGSTGINNTYTFNFGKIPDLYHFSKKTIIFQAAFVDKGLPVMNLFGFTNAIKIDIGEGWIPNANEVVKCSTVYSYGKDLCPAEPDSDFYAAYLSPRAPILKLN